jgi:polar amino acid transport system substrate-binding protein
MRAGLLALVILFGAGAGVAGAQTCAPVVAPPDLLAAGKLQMSINPTLPPQQYLNEKGELQGLNVEIGEAVAQHMCLEPVFIRMDFPAMLPALLAGRFDAIDTGLFWTQERAKVAFLVPYGQQAISVAVLNASTLKVDSLADLSGHSVTVETNSYQDGKLRQVNAELAAKGAKPIEVHSFTTATDCVAALRAGQAEASVANDDTARALAKLGFAKVIAHGLNGSDLTLAFRSRPVAAAAAKALAAIRADGSYDRIFDKFGMTELPPGPFGIRAPAGD